MSARSLSPVDLRRRNPGPSLRGGGGGPAGAPAPLAVMDAQSQGHIPLPGKRNFPIDLPSKEVSPCVGRSAWAPRPECLRNAIENESGAPAQRSLLLPLQFPLGVLCGVRVQQITCTYLLVANSQTAEVFRS